MPAEIIQETAPGLVLVHLPDGSQRELPLDLAQQVVAESYGEGTPSYTSSTGPGFVPPVQQATAPQETLPPDAFGATPSSTPEVVAPETAATPPPVELAAPSAPSPVVPTPPGLLTRQQSSVSATVPLGDPRRAGAPPETPNLQQGLDLVQQGAYDQLHGQELESEAQALTGTRTAELNRAVQLANQEELAWQERAGAEAQKEALEYRTRYEEALNQVPNMNPGRFWQNLGGFGQALAMISAGIGGMLQVTQGGPNRALEHINQLVEQDLRAQETDIATAREKVYRIGVARGMAREDTAQMFQDRASQYGFRMKALIAAGDADIAKYQSPIAQANWFKMRGKMLESLGGAVNQVGQQAYNNSLNRWSAVADMEIKRGQLRIAAMNAATNRAEVEARKAAAAAKDVPAAVMVADPRTGNLWLMDPQIAKDVTPAEIAKVRDGEKGLSAYSEAIRIAKEYGAELAKAGRSYGGKGSTTRFLGSEERQALEQKRELAVMNIRHALAGSALTEPEIKIWERVLPPPTSYTSLDAVDNIDTFVKERINNAQERFVNQYRLHKQNPDGSFSKVELQKEWGGKITPPEEPKAQDVGALNVRLGSVDFTDSATGESTAEAAVQDAKEIVSRFGKEKETVPPSRWVNSYRAIRDQAAAAEAAGHKNAATRLTKLADTLELEMLSYDKELSRGKAVYRGRKFEGGMERTHGQEPVFYPLLNPPQFSE